MIVTVTMNPAIDKTVRLQQFKYGNVNRVNRPLIDVGGKGINVSKAIRSLGGNTTASGFIGGNNGIMIERDLKYRGIETDFIILEEETRANLKLIDDQGIVTEINEIGPEVPSFKIQYYLEHLLEVACEDTLFVLSGSVPANVDASIYREIIRRVHEKGSKVFLDAEGELFALAVEEHPEYVKPNRSEIQKYFGNTKESSKEELLKMGRYLRKKGIETVIISLGEEGALYFYEDKIWDVQGLKVDANSPVGAGDALVAGYCLGVDRGLSQEECIRLSLAASAAAVMTEGTRPPSKEQMESLVGQVNWREINARDRT